MVGLPDLVSKNVSHPVKFEFQIYNRYFLRISVFHILDTIILKKYFICEMQIHLNFLHFGQPYIEGLLSSLSL